MTTSFILNMNVRLFSEFFLISVINFFVICSSVTKINTLKAVICFKSCYLIIVMTKLCQLISIHIDKVKLHAYEVRI